MNLIKPITRESTAAWALTRWRKGQGATDIDLPLRAAADALPPDATPEQVDAAFAAVFRDVRGRTGATIFLDACQECETREYPFLSIGEGETVTLCPACVRAGLALLAS